MENKGHKEGDKEAGEVKATKNLTKKLIEKRIEAIALKGFTASASQLDALEAAGHTKYSKTYMGAINRAFAKVEANLRPGEMVGWTSTKGYHVHKIRARRLPLNLH